MNRRTLLRAAAGVGCCGVAGCHYGPTYRYRYKLTLAVRAEGRLFRGANVVECGAFAPKRGPWTFPGETVQGFTHGEANVLDIGTGRLVVALLTNRDRPSGAPKSDWYDDDPTAVLERVYDLPPSTGFDESGVNPTRALLDQQRGPRPIGSDGLPTLVTFRDAKDPSTATQLNPDDFAATFGPGVKLESATVEVTDDHITRGAVRKRLPWVFKPTDGSGYVPQEFALLPGGRDNPKYLDAEHKPISQLLIIHDYYRS